MIIDRIPIIREPLEALAAARAENGDFEDAERIQLHSMQLETADDLQSPEVDEKHLEESRKRLESYASRKPWRHQPKEQADAPK